MPDRDETIEQAFDEASERARNPSAPRRDTAEDVAAREAARNRRAYQRGRELQAPNLQPGDDEDE